MELLLDIGNSSVNWAIQESTKFVSSGAFAYSGKTIQQDMEQNLSIREKPAAVMVANVAGNPVLNSLNDWVKRQWQQECWQASVSAEYKDLKNSYQDTSQMGVDRWLAMIASWEANQSALCLVSCGTALTVDLIDHDGNHKGGYIIPGIELMQQALINNTEQINTDIKKQPSIESAKDTQTAINNGAFAATVFMIDSVTERFYATSNNEVKCIISGGMANLINPLLKHSFYYEPNLVLMGLSILYRAQQ
ncbi:MAG: type III pantothenate kinase [Gammaproteobacteria bacterium]|jgi:type III pantothenate kinase